MTVLWLEIVKIIKQPMDNTLIKNGEWSRAVPVLGIDPVITEIDIMLLLTGELLVGQTREGLQFFHKHHLRTT